MSNEPFLSEQKRLKRELKRKLNYFEAKRLKIVIIKQSLASLDGNKALFTLDAVCCCGIHKQWATAFWHFSILCENAFKSIVDSAADCV